MADNVAGQTASQSPDQLTSGSAQGKVVYDATTIVAADSTRVQVGFLPRYVRWDNATDRTMIEWFEGMAANTCIKTAAAGTRTLETANGGITICDSDGTANTNGKAFSVLQNATLAAILASKVCTWKAHG